MSEQPNILIVDDNPASLTAIEACLSDLGCRLVSASSGEEALRQLLHEEFAVVLLDIVMPGIDGFETAKLIRGRPRSRGTPIIFLTGVCLDEAHQLEGYETGAVDYLLKPFNPTILRSKVRVFIELFQARQHAQESADREAALRELDRLKDDFLAIISHELRTPLAVIMGTLEGVQDQLMGPLSIDLKQAVDTIQVAAQKLLGLVENLLEMSNILAGKLVLSRVPVSFEEVLENALAEAASAARERNVTVEKDVAELPPLMLDPARIQEVLGHMLSNAIKFSKPGSSVKVSARREGERLWCEVQDWGIGIPEEQMTHLFEPLMPLDSTSTRETGGLGLGLSLSKRIVEAHGGCIGVRSMVGQGSSFYFEIPLLPAPSSPERRTEAQVQAE